MNWRNFFDDILPDFESKNKNSSEAVEVKPGQVMICFVNRYQEAMDGIKYKIQYEGKELIGVTTIESYCFKIQTSTVKPILVSVWSRKSKNFKALDSVVPVMGRNQLVRKTMFTARVHGRTAPHPETPRTAPRPTTPPPPTAPGSSPVVPQGVAPALTSNEQGEPQIQVQRPVPGLITLNQLRVIFPMRNQASDAYLQQVADEVNTDLVKYKLDTPLRKAHFFSQIKAETGDGMKPLTEDWEYSRAALLSFSSYYRQHPDEATQDAYLKDSHRVFIRHADQEAIGRKHFARLNGNRQATHPEDGSNFRGRGLLQITGFEKYSGFKNEYCNYWLGTAPDSVENPQCIVQFPYSVRSAIWFWVKFRIYTYADFGSTPEHVTEVSRHVNGDIMGLQKRKDVFVLAYGAFR